MISEADSALLRTFATLADSLVDDFQVLDILQTLVEACTDLLDVSAAGILLLGADGHLDLAASTNEANRTVELMQLSAQAGPCIQSFRTGRMVAVPDLAAAPAAWSAFRDSAMQQGFAATYAVPLRLRQTRIGALNLMNTSGATMDEPHLLAARALADVATIAILQERTIREHDTLARQLQTALDSRVIVEQAKGVIAHTRGTSIEEAFTILRDHARAERRPISEIAEAVVRRQLVLPR
jgi:GAF domain-containing protein